jgi:hypothetical protein
MSGPTLSPKPGFDWGHLPWGRPDSVPTVVCSYCSASIGEDDMPLILSNAEGWTVRFCDACQRKWFGLESFGLAGGDDDEP